MVQTANLLTQYHLISLRHLQLEAHVRFNLAIAQGDPIPPSPFAARVLSPATDDADKKSFYVQVDSSVIAAIIKNSLSPSGYADLLLHKEKFAFHDNATGQLKYDRPSMVFLMFEKLTQIQLSGWIPC